MHQLSYSGNKVKCTSTEITPTHTKQDRAKQASEERDLVTVFNRTILTEASAGYLSKCLLSFITIKSLLCPIMRLRDWRSNDKASYLIPNHQIVWVLIICSICHEIYTRLSTVYAMKYTHDYVQYISWNVHMILYSISNEIYTRSCAVYAMKYAHDYAQNIQWNIHPIMYIIYH